MRRHAAAHGLAGLASAALTCPTDAITVTTGVYGGADDTGADVCIPAGNDVVVRGGESWNTLTLGGSLRVGDENACGSTPPYGIALANGGAIASGGALALWSSSSCFEGGDTSLTIKAGTLTNGGTIFSVLTDTCSECGSPSASGGQRTITGNLTNTGTVSVQGDTLAVDGPGTFDNSGLVSITGSNTNLVVQGGETFTNDTGGTIDGDVTGGTPNQLQMNGGTFIQGAGTISPTALDGTTPNPQPVVLTNAALDYTGAGSGSITFGGTGSLSGNLSAGQSLIISGGTGCGATATAQISSDVTNAGSITLSGVPFCQPGSNAQISVLSGTFTNSGTLTMASNGASPMTTSCSGACALSGTIINIGAISVNASVTVSGPGTFDNKGAITIADGQTLTVPGAGVGQGLTFVNDAGGAIVTTGDGSSGQFQMQGGNTFEQGAGITTGSPILVQGSMLDYTGPGASTIALGNGSETLSGNVVAGQILDVQGYGTCPGPGTAVTTSGNVTNAGTINVFTGGGSCQNVSLTMPTGSILTNSGTINMSTPYPVQLFGSITNTGTINLNSSGGATLSGPGTFDNKGSMNVADNQIVTIPGAGVGQGLTFIDDAGGAIVASGDGSSGQLQMEGGNTFEQGNGSITGTEPLLVNDTLEYSGTGASHVDVRGAIALSGNIAAQQTLELQDSGGFCQWPTPAVTAATGFTNAGTIITTACNGAPSLTVTSGTLLNTGQIVSSAGLVLHATVTNAGTIQANYNTTLYIDALTNYAAATQTLSGGTYQLYDASALVVPGMDIQTNSATIDLYGGGRLSDGGTNSLQDLSSNTRVLSFANGANLTTDALVNSGQIALGTSDTLRVNGTYTQTATGSFAPAIAGTGAGSTYGQLRVNGQTSLAGTLALTEANGYVPVPGDSQQVIAYDSESGHVAQVMGTSAGSGLSFVIEYDPNALTVVARPTQIAASPTRVRPFQTVVLTGTAFSPNESVSLYWDSTASAPLTTTTADASSAFTTHIAVPQAPAGQHALLAVGQNSTVTVSTTLTVVPETVLYHSSGAQGSVNGVVGFGFGTGETVRAYWLPGNKLLGQAATNSLGTETNLTFTVPLSPTGTYYVVSVGQHSHASAVSVFSIRPSLTITPASGARGSTATLVGTGFAAHETITLRWDCASSTCSGLPVLGTPTTNANGDVGLAVTIPTTTTLGGHTIGAHGSSSALFATTTYNVTS